MNARFLVNKGRLLSGTVAVAAAAVFVAFFFVFAPSPASAGGGCETAMSPDSALYPIEFSGGVTETLPGPVVEAGQVLCIEGAGVFDVGFKASAEFFLNGGHIGQTFSDGSFFDGANVDSFATFLVTGADVLSTVQWSPPDKANITAYVGNLRPAARPTPPPTTTQPAPPAPWNIVALPASFGVGDKAYWELKPISGTVNLEISAKVPFTVSAPWGDTDVLTPTLSGSYEYLVNDVPGGVFSAPALTARSGYWQARLSGTPNSILRMKAAAPAPQASPATTTNGLISVWKRASDGAYFLTANCTGVPVQFDSNVHHHVGGCSGARGRIAGAPAPMRFPNLPLVVKP